MRRGAFSWVIVATAVVCMLPLGPRRACRRTRAELSFSGPRRSHGGQGGEHSHEPALWLFGEISGDLVLS